MSRYPEPNARAGTGRAPMLIDPVTGIARMGVSSSGREAARVVKFSPEGAPRDLLVFSEVSPIILSCHFIPSPPSHFRLPLDLTPIHSNVSRQPCILPKFGGYDHLIFWGQNR